MRARPFFPVVVLLMVFMPDARASAQMADLSVGGTVLNGTMGGWYGDAAMWLTPDVAVVGDVSGYYSQQAIYGNQQLHALLGGARVRVLARRRVSVFGQLLGGQARYAHTAPTEWMPAVQPGVGVHVALNDKWSLRVRSDLMISSGGGEPIGGFSIGAGITRRLGR